MNEGEQKKNISIVFLIRFYSVLSSCSRRWLGNGPNDIVNEALNTITFLDVITDFYGKQSETEIGVHCN